eukprot:651190-Rhodomonas_salina.1
MSAGHEAQAPPASRTYPSRQRHTKDVRLSTMSSSVARHETGTPRRQKDCSGHGRLTTVVTYIRPAAIIATRLPPWKLAAAMMPTGRRPSRCEGDPLPS